MAKTRSTATARKRPNPPDDTRRNRLKTRRDISELTARLEVLEDGDLRSRLAALEDTVRAQQEQIQRLLQATSLVPTP